MAREGYLVNAGEDTIHANEIKADSPQEKRKNWWYYHKGPLIAIVLLAAVVGSILYSMFGGTKPDYTVGLMTSYTMPENGREELERVLSQYADDRNGDGKTVVEIVGYVFSTTVPSTSDALQQQQAAVARFAGDTLTNESMIFLHNEEAFAFMEADFSGYFQYTDGSPMPEDATDYENAMRPWRDFKALDSFVPVTKDVDAFDSDGLQQLYQQLRVSIRAAEGTSIEKDKKDMEYYQDCLAFYQRLLTGELPGAEE